MEKSKRNFRKWETALLLALSVTIFTGIWAQGQQKELASKLIRLHVVAASDDEADQETKLAVRDRALEMLSPLLDGAEDIDSAIEVVGGELGALEDAAEEIACGKGRECDVVVTLGFEDYPTRQYEGFALPAGEYMSLRIVLGEGEGHNWWCVVFPPLCLSAAEVISDRDSGLTDEDVALITEDSSGYKIKFRLLEIWNKIIKEFD